MIESNNTLFEVEIDNYSGPLDVLLDLAKAQKSKSRRYINNKISRSIS